jgi:hypothetical protein
MSKLKAVTNSQAIKPLRHKEWRTYPPKKNVVISVLHIVVLIAIERGMQMYGHAPNSLVQHSQKKMTMPKSVAACAEQL